MTRPYDRFMEPDHDDRPSGKYDIESPEDIVIDRQYALSINPCDAHQYFGEQDRVSKFVKWATLYLVKTISPRVRMNVEVSRKGRLHMHGVITFRHINDIKSFYINEIHTLLLKCTVCVKPIDDAAQWAEYCTKSKHLIDEIVTNDVNLTYIIKQASVAKPPVKKFSDYPTDDKPVKRTNKNSSKTA